MYFQLFFALYLKKLTHEFVKLNYEIKFVVSLALLYEIYL